MAEYNLLTIWRIEAPLEEVYAAVHDTLHWPDWWPSVRKVALTATGDAVGIDSVWRYVWKGGLPYRIVFDVRATRIEKLVSIEGDAYGDLYGTGYWHFTQYGALTIVRCQWHVHTTRWWMNLLAPLTRSLFIRNHTRVMTQGGEGLAHQLGVPVPGQENIDLMSASVPSRERISRRKESGGADSRGGPVVAIVAGVLAVAAQLALSNPTLTPKAARLFHNAQQNVARVLGTAVLRPPLMHKIKLFSLKTLMNAEGLGQDSAKRDLALSVEWRA